MADFKYTALDRAGKEISGTLAGRDLSDAAGKVRSLGYYPVNVAPMNGSGAIRLPGAKTAPTQAVAPTGKRVGKVQILLFTRELADLIDAGLPIDRALSVLIEQSDSEGMKALVHQIQHDVRAGKPLSEAIRNFPREFPELFANMIHAGEVSGQLADVMTRLADFMEKEQIRRSQVIAALTYPMVLVGVAALAVTFLLTFVIPKLQDVFKDLGADLPLPTQILLSSTGFIGAYKLWLFVGIVVGYYLFRAWANTHGGRRTLDAFRLQAPIMGNLTRKIVMARFVRTLGTLLGGGVPILDSMQIAASAVGNTVTGESVMDARDRVRQGETLSRALVEAGGFLPLVVHMSAVGEETGRLPGMLLRTANTLDFEVDNALRRMTSLVEPMVVLFMGGFVGFVVLSILLPIFEANTIVK